MRRSSFLGMLFVVTGCWLLAGPGGLVLRAALACRNGHMHMDMNHHSGAHPCVCDQMADGFDLAVSPTVPAPLAAGRLVVHVVLTLRDPATPAFPSSTPRTPPTPPPNTRA
jgi:hypothetical protein